MNAPHCQLALDQLRTRAQQWEVSIDETWETPSSVLSFGLRRGSRVVLKITKQQGDEWYAGEVLRAFESQGTVRVYESDEGAVLLERLDPGEQLVQLVQSGKDAEATEILAQTMQQMAGCAAPDHCPTILDWARGFDRYLNTGDKQIPQPLVHEARDLYQTLAASQRRPMLLHGDLHHYNILFDSNRGWVAIDPKGLVGELEYEVGAMLRNPVELPDLFTSQGTIERRLALLANILDLDYQRSLSWTFAQAVLSAIWDVEDGYRVKPDHRALRLAYAIKPLLGLG